MFKRNILVGLLMFLMFSGCSTHSPQRTSLSLLNATRDVYNTTQNVVKQLYLNKIISDEIMIRDIIPADKKANAALSAAYDSFRLYVIFLDDEHYSDFVKTFKIATDLVKIYKSLVDVYGR